MLAGCDDEKTIAAVTGQSEAMVKHYTRHVRPEIEAKKSGRICANRTLRDRSIMSYIWVMGNEARPKGTIRCLKLVRQSFCSGFEFWIGFVNGDEYSSAPTVATRIANEDEMEAA